MIVYAEKKQEISPDIYINNLKELTRYTGGMNLSRARNLLIEYGELESGLSDRENKGCDGSGTMLLRKAGLITGMILLDCWNDNFKKVQSNLTHLREQLEEIEERYKDGIIKISHPEGYVYYSLYPEAYIHSTEKFLSSYHVSKAVVIGIRSIGTGLSSAVAAVLVKNGIETESFTIRPRGEYFDRKACFTKDIEDLINLHMDAAFLIVDEGPGLSGSSISSAAERLSSIGVPYKNIFLFPSNLPVIEKMYSKKSQEIWRRHGITFSTFEEVWLSSGKLENALSCSIERELSAGEWRKEFFSDVEKYPAVNPNFERRKFIIVCSGDMFNIKASSKINTQELFIKFAGLGKYGEEAFRRAYVLYTAGFSPRVFDIKEGFLLYEKIKGRPLLVSDINDTLLDRIAGYISFIKEKFPANVTYSFDQINEMIYWNIKEALGSVYAEKFKNYNDWHPSVFNGNAAAIDGHMQPWEWIITDEGKYLKTDNTDHYRDHFYPGCQDIAWDIAGTIVEFHLNDVQKSFLLDHFISISEDQDIRNRLNYYMTAYSAFRLGFASFSAGSLKGTKDEGRFRVLLSYYAECLKEEIDKLLPINQ